jgi:hypothetical protein
MQQSNKETIVVGAGAGIGVAQTLISKQYDFVLVGAIPSPWNTMASLGNIIIGGVFFGITQFSSLIENKSYDLNQFLKVYGMTTLIGGLMNGIFPAATLTVQSASRNGYVSTLPGGRNGHIAHTYYPDYTGTFIERSQTRAKGFGSDVTKNPMAQIPTTIPYNKVLY